MKKLNVPHNFNRLLNRPKIVDRKFHYIKFDVKGKELDAIRGGNFGVIDIDSVEIENLDAPLVKVYGELGEIRTQNLIGVKDIYTVTA